MIKVGSDPSGKRESAARDCVEIGSCAAHMALLGMAGVFENI